jgi:C4-dicarboxylate-specific signal transduction histidine kinase
VTTLLLVYLQIIYSFDRAMELLRAEKERAEEEHRSRVAQREQELREQEAAIAAQIAEERERAALTAEENQAKVRNWHRLPVIGCMKSRNSEISSSLMRT